MNTTRTIRGSGPSKSRMLEALGIDEMDELAYRWLLEHPGTTPPDIAHALRVSARRAQKILDALEEQGLVTHTPQKPRRYVPAAPDLAFEHLVLQRQMELHRAQESIKQLQRQSAALRREEPEQIIELITSYEGERQAFEQIQRSARHEVIAMTRPPVLISRLDLPPEQDQRMQRETQAAGVRYRSIVDAEFLAVPGAIARIRSDMAAGEEVRVSATVPFKLALADRRVALIPLQEGDSNQVLLVRSSTLLNALYVLFELLWERAAPITFAADGVLQTGTTTSRMPEEAVDLIALMAAGLNDKAIAYELGLAKRTLNRRIAELMGGFDARTRFQTGWLAALRLKDRAAAVQGRPKTRRR